MNKVIDKRFRSCRFVSTIAKHPVNTTSSWMQCKVRKAACSKRVLYNTNWSECFVVWTHCAWRIVCGLKFYLQAEGITALQSKEIFATYTFKLYCKTCILNILLSHTICDRYEKEQGDKVFHKRSPSTKRNIMLQRMSFQWCIVKQLVT